MSVANTDDAQRVDRWLWCARFFKSRTTATKICGAGKVRINRKIVVKASANVHIGDILTFPQGSAIRVIKVRSMAMRRGPAVEARLLYDDLTIIEPEKDQPAPSAPQRESGSGRPTKRERRAIERFVREAE